MIICHQHKFIFIKTRKTAGTSIEIALSKVVGDGDVLSYLQMGDERTREEATGRLAQNDRIPFSRYTGIDYYELLKRRRRHRFREHESAGGIRKRLEPEIWNSYFKFCFERNPFDRAISLYHWRHRSGKKQVDLNDYLLVAPGADLSNWDLYNQDGFLRVDFVGRYERLQEDFDQICKKIGLGESLALPKSKHEVRRDRKPYQELLNADARNRIETVCAREIRLLDYQW